MPDRIERLSVPEPNSGCWLWTSRVDPTGYALLDVACDDGKRRDRVAHRIAYEAFRGPIPEGLVCDHTCATKCCVNPWHIDIVTLAENSRRGTHGKPKRPPAPMTHCLRGHEYTRPPGTQGKKRCDICRRETKRRFARRLAETL